MSKIPPLAFSNNTATELEDLLGFSFDDIAHWSTGTTEMWAPDGVTQHSLEGDPGGGNSRFEWPSWYTSQVGGASGTYLIAYKASSNGVNNSRALLSLTFPLAGSTIKFETSGSGLVLEVGGNVVDSTGPIPWSSWNFFELVFDATSDPWTASLYHNGTLVASGSRSRPAESSAPTVVSDVLLAGAVQYYGGLWIETDTANAGVAPHYFSFFDGNADGTEGGTVSQSTGSDNYAVVGLPLDQSTYSQISSPSAGNHVEILTNGGGDTIADRIGTSIASISALGVIGVVSGQSLNAMAVIGDGTSEDDGTVVAIDASEPTVCVVNTTVKPSGGAWGGGDNVNLKLEVDSV